MIEGCSMWQREGLNPPEIVKRATAEYFRDEDAVGRWLEDDTTMEAGLGEETMQDLYASYKQWAHDNGEYPMTLKRLSTTLEQRKGLEKSKHPKSRRASFRGVSIINRLGVEFN
jgi:putative DNA primase/helicase